VRGARGNLPRVNTAAPASPPRPPKPETLIERHVGASRCGELGKLAHVRQDTQLVVMLIIPWSLTTAMSALAASRLLAVVPKRAAIDSSVSPARTE